MRTQHTRGTDSVPQQQFFVPHLAPFLEVRTTLNSTLPYEEHFHTAFSLGLILQGKTRFCLNGTEYTAQKGDIVLIAQGQAHSCNPVDGPRGYHMLLMDAAWLREHSRCRLEDCTPLIRDSTLFRKASAIMEAILANHANAVSMLKTLLTQLCEHPKRNTIQAKRPKVVFPPLGNGEDAPPSVSALARHAGMRRESFSRAMRQQTGLPPSLYLHCLRMEKARVLLRQGKTIAEVALATGYVDQSHFHRVFVRFCAVTPGRYRNNMSHPYKK